jgi:hypothetical protein
MKESELLDRLRRKVLEVAGITSISPRACEQLAIVMEKAIRQKISATTLKRLYGFAASPFKISLHTKNCLAQFAYGWDWAKFVQHDTQDSTTDSTTSATWNKLRSKVNVVNSYMLQAVKNKSVIPFNEMIYRPFIHQHFKQFATSGTATTVISSPTGYGKTIALCQWLIQKIDDSEQQDLFLYFNSSHLLNASDSSLGLQSWLLKLIGLEPSTDYNTEAFNEGANVGNFYFVIDGFDELMFRKHEFLVLLDIVLDLIAIYQHSTWFKIVLVMRDSTWNNWKRKLMFHPESWFLGNMNEQGENVGLFSNEEVAALIRMQRTFTAAEVAAKDFVMLRFPLFHQLFYRKYKKIIQYDQFTELLTFELAADYMDHGVLYGNQHLPKIDFIFHLLGKLVYHNGYYKAKTVNLHLENTNYLNAYNSLVQLGFLREALVIETISVHRFVYFNHIHLLGCCIAISLLEKSNVFSVMSLEYIDIYWNSLPDLKTNILKWCLFHLVQEKQLSQWIKGYQESLPPIELEKLEGFIVKLKLYQQHIIPSYLSSQTGQNFSG